MLSKYDLIYLGTIMFLTTRGGVIKDADIEQAQFVASKVFDKIFNNEEGQVSEPKPIAKRGH